MRTGLPAAWGACLRDGGRELWGCRARGPWRLRLPQGHTLAGVSADPRLPPPAAEPARPL